MPSLKEFRNRIVSVKSTRKITAAMKMVAASKLRRAQHQAVANQPYAVRMANVLGRLVAAVGINETSPVLIAGTGKADTHLLLVITSDRGLCGGFNAFIVRAARLKVRELLDEGKDVKILCVGRKGRDMLKRDYADKIVHTFEGWGRKRLTFADAVEVSEYITDMIQRQQFDVCTVLYNRFKSVMTQLPTTQQLIPFAVHASEEVKTGADTGALYEFEPSEKEILETLLPLNLSVQIFRALLDSAAGEQAARMTAMDNATRNAGEMINKLTLNYNRARQAHITKELIEIISGAEAV
ncbi:MAG: F0F1 ATP synthase subunit gamma [Alphaproteobacteria bacterium]|nr:F0F1 ATP synthase subunit gamma [Alphaproteobacteria bacterium]